MRLKKIKIKNIRSYNDAEIEFPEGSTLLSGDIGCGKTSILLAIEFALFGLQPGQKGSSLLRNGEDSAEVSIDFEIGGNQISVERTLKRNSKSVTQDFCAITLEGERREIAVTELKNLILETLDYPKEFSKKQNILYKFTVYTPQEEMKQIILQDSETRLNTLRHIFGVDKYKKILENVSVINAKIKEEKKVKEALISNLENDRIELEKRENDVEDKQKNLYSMEKELLLKKELRKKVEEERNELTKKREERLKIQSEIEKTKIMIVNKNDSINNNKKVIEQLNKQIDEAKDVNYDEKKPDMILKEIQIKRDEKDNVREDLLKVTTLISSLNMKNEDNDKLRENLSHLEICPTCLQNVNSVYKSNVFNDLHSKTVENIKKIETLTIDKTKFSEKLNKISFEVQKLEKEYNELKILSVKVQNINEKKDRISEISKGNLLLEKDIELLSKHLDLLKNSSLELSKYDLMFEQKNKELESASSEERTAEIRVAELRKEIDVFLKYVGTIKEKIKSSEEIKMEYNYLSEMETWLSKKFAPVISHIEKNVMIKLKSEFSHLFEEWFNMLVSESFNVRISDDFSPIIEQQDYEIDYAFLSGGERTAVALAYRLALNQVINSLLSKLKTKDLVILDEPTDGFSDQQLDKMRDVLQELNVGQLIIVSHEQKIEGFVDNVIKLKKEQGSSEILK